MTIDLNPVGTGAPAPLRIGFIPLADAAALIVAVDKGFARAQGLDVELVREISWSNVRDRLNIGQFDGAHLLAPVAVASSLGLGHVRVPILAPFSLGLNGNAITVTAALYRALAAEADGDIARAHASDHPRYRRRPPHRSPFRWLPGRSGPRTWQLACARCARPGTSARAPHG